MIGIVLPLVLLVIALFYFAKPLHYWRNKGVRQSDAWPLLGDSWRIFRGKNAIWHYISWIYEQRKDSRYFGVYAFTKPELAIYDPDLIKQITTKEFDSFSDHNQLYIDNEIDPYWGNALLILRGPKWKHMRSTLSPSYTGSKMRIIFDLMAETADNFISYFLSKNEDLIEVEMKDIFTRYTNDVIATAAFGLKVDSLRDPNNLFYYHGIRITNLQTFSAFVKLILMESAPIIWKIFGITFLGKDQVKYFKDVLFDTIKEREEKNIFRPDLVNILMEARKEKANNKQEKPLTDEEILSQALIFFFGGFDTISTTLSFGAYELATNKDVQDKLRKEINEAYNKQGKLSYDMLQDMKYLDMVVSEILRKWPTFVVTDRRVTKPFTVEPVNKDEVPFQLDPGTSVLLPIYHLQRDPKYFPNPEKFDPERFSEENKHNINPYTYMPFGAGPRMCIGYRFALLEVKCLLFNLLRNFEIVPTKKTPIPPKIKMPSFQYTIEGGFWLGLKRVKA